MVRRSLLAAATLLAVTLIPIAIRSAGVTGRPEAEQLVIISPHNEAIRCEFEDAFRRHCSQELGRPVDIDWRTPGGTSEIVRYIKGAYTAAFRHLLTSTGERWDSQVQAAFLDRKLKEADASPRAWAARRTFLDSDIGIGIDLFFGGGQYDYGQLAGAGVLVPCGLRTRCPELFQGTVPILTAGVNGEAWYDTADRYYGVCLSSFGICSNRDRLSELGIADRGFPRQWDDLADARLYGQIGVADPSKSGSITKCFEMLIQQKMASVLAAHERAAGGALTERTMAQALAAGWTEAMFLIRKIGANARYFTFSAGKVPVDVAQGSVAAGMCIDFYGRTQAEWEHVNTGNDAMSYVTPLGGSSVSADPIGLLRGAPHQDAAKAFIDFALSRKGQQLWNYRPGAHSDGPERYALRRLPIRRDMYTPEDRALMSDPDAIPFELAESFVYHPERTARLFGLIRILIRVMIIDCHRELRTAWKAILDAGGPEAAPLAVETFTRLPFPYEQSHTVARSMRGASERTALTREWAVFFRNSYEETARLTQRKAPTALRP